MGTDKRGCSQLLPNYPLGSHHLVHQPLKSSTILPSLMRERWNTLAHCGPQAEVVTLLIKGTAEAGGYFEVPKPSHRMVSLLDSTMILFNAIVQVGIAAMCHLLA